MLFHNHNYSGTVTTKMSTLFEFKPNKLICYAHTEELLTDFKEQHTIESFGTWKCGQNRTTTTKNWTKQTEIIWLESCLSYLSLKCSNYENLSGFTATIKMQFDLIAKNTQYVCAARRKSMCLWLFQVFAFFINCQAENNCVTIDKMVRPANKINRV